MDNLGGELKKKTPLVMQQVIEACSPLHGHILDLSVDTCASFHAAKESEGHIFGFEADEEIHMELLDALLQSLNVEASMHQFIVDYFATIDDIIEPQNKTCGCNN